MPPAKPEPGRDQEMARRTEKLNVLFALTSIALLLTFSWMVWADYDREWKRYQKKWNELEVQYTQKQIEEALGKEGAERHKAIQAEMARGEQEIAEKSVQVAKARSDIEELNAEWYAVDQRFRFKKADIDVARYEYEEAAHHDPASAGDEKAKLERLEKEWLDLRLELEQVEGRRASARARLEELQQTRLEAEKELKALSAERTRLEARLEGIQPGFVSFVRNLPVLDMANPSLKINQIMPANLHDDVIFTGTPKVDRCTTCHLGIDRKGFENAEQPFRTHPNLELYLQGPHPMERIGCTACHQGRGRATSFQKAAHVPSTKEQQEAWGRYTGSHEYESLHYWDLPMMAKGHTESQCVKCHQGMVEVPGANRLNAGLRLMERYGCYGCHKIKGWEGLRKAGPDLTKILAKTDEEWIYRWIKEPRSFRTTRMPQVWDVRIDETTEQKARNDVEANAVVAYLADRSAEDSYPEPPRGNADAGRRTLESVGCLACHRVDDEDERGIDGHLNASFRSHGPNLEGSGSKLKPGWVYAWLRDPKAYWHDTRMPDLRLSDKEAADVTAYLMTLRNEEFTAKPRPAIDGALRDAIVREYLVSQLPVQQADEKLQSMDDRQKTLFLGERTIGRYGCFGCHQIEGFETANPIGVELTEQGSKLVERLDFGYEHGLIPHTLPGWLHRKVMEPRVFDRGKAKRPEELLRMPKFWLAPEEGDAIVTAIMSLTKEQVPLAAQKQLTADEKYVQEGARLVRDFNCRGCHQIGEDGGTIRAVVESQIEAAGGDTLNAQALSPPLLYNARSKTGEGARVQTAWLHDFIRDPADTVRPWLDLRMPTFHFSEEQINTVTRYFAAMDGVPYPYEPRPQVEPTMVAAGHDLFQRWQCVKCHVVAGRLPNQEPANMAPDLAKVPERLRAAWLVDWLKDPGRIQPGTRMPANFPEKPEENAFPEILGGDQEKQIAAVRAYLLTLGGNRRTAAAAASTTSGSTASR